MFHKSFILFCLLLFINSFQAADNTHIFFQVQDFDQFVKNANEQDKAFMVVFYGENCEECQLLEKHSFQYRPLVEVVNQHFLAFKVEDKQTNANALVQKYQIKNFPTILVFNRRGRVVQTIQETKTANELEEILNMVALNDIKP